VHAVVHPPLDDDPLVEVLVPLELAVVVEPLVEVLVLVELDVVVPPPPELEAPLVVVLPPPLDVVLAEVDELAVVLPPSPPSPLEVELVEVEVDADVDVPLEVDVVLPDDDECVDVPVLLLLLLPQPIATPWSATAEIAKANVARAFMRVPRVHFKRRSVTAPSRSASETFRLAKRFSSED
jgi:hypothetical protein